MTSPGSQERPPNLSFAPLYSCPGYPQMSNHFLGVLPTLCPQNCQAQFLLFLTNSYSLSCGHLYWYSAAAQGCCRCTLSRCCWSCQTWNSHHLYSKLTEIKCHLIIGMRGRGSGCGTAAMTIKGAVTNLATPIGGCEVMSWLLHITRRLMNTLNLVATAQ